MLILWILESKKLFSIFPPSQVTDFRCCSWQILLLDVAIISLCNEMCRISRWRDGASFSRAELGDARTLRVNCQRRPRTLFSHQTLKIQYF
jgi:hypothetical protein